MSDLFLAHASQDKGPLLDGAIEVLTDAGAAVYADYLDPEAKHLPPDEFGAFFSQAIKDTHRMVVLLTEKTASSRWVPWELGLAHGIHNVENAAVWPVVEAGRQGAWAKQEYFAMYPRIEWVNFSNGAGWGVREPKSGDYWRLANWLSL